MTKETTLVKFQDDEYKKIPTVNIKFVDGEEGVFGTYQDGDQVYFLGGDDGAWRVMATYHIYWCEAIAKNIYSYCTQGRRK